MSGWGITTVHEFGDGGQAIPQAWVVAVRWRAGRGGWGDDLPTDDRELAREFAKRGARTMTEAMIKARLISLEVMCSK